MQRVFIDLDKDPKRPRAALTGEAAPTLSGILGAPLNVRVVFFRDAVGEALAADSTGRFVLKQKDARLEDALFNDITIVPDGSGENTFYKFGGRLLNPQLSAAIGEEDEITLVGCVTWTEPGTEEDRCEDFEFVLKNSAARDEDSIPANADARWAWLKEAAPEANGFTHDDETKTLTVDAGGITEESDPVASAALAAHAARTDNPHATTKTQVGLGNVDNTADTAKPVSTAQQTALNLKATVVALDNHIGNVSAHTKSQVGLGNVDNTADTAKPVSTAQQTALNAKASTAALTAHIIDQTNPHGTTKAQVGLGNVDNTSDTAKPVSTAQQTALDGKVPTTRNVATQHSLTGGGDLSTARTLSLVGDTATPGANKVYGTDGSGTRGWKNDPAGGGGSISTPHVLWVTSGGDDTTGDGSLAAPYLTAQKAFDMALADTGVSYHLMFGVGDFGAVNCNIGWPERITFGGLSHKLSIFGPINSSAASPNDTYLFSDLNVTVAYVQVNGGKNLSIRQLCSAGDAIAVGYTGAAGSGGTPGDMVNQGGVGGTGDTGGTGGLVIVRDSIIAGLIASQGGAGGAGGPGGSDGGFGSGPDGDPGGTGAGGEVRVARTRCGDINGGSGYYAGCVVASTTGGVTDGGGNAVSIPFEF